MTRGLAFCAVLALAGCCGPRDDTHRPDNLAFGEWTMPAKVIVTEPPYCEPQWRAYRTAAMNPMSPASIDHALLLRVVHCYRRGVEAL